jgi:putative PIN family toxin of toxin-antitoxin system
MTPAPQRNTLCVLDTQVLLDWAVFDDARVRPWAQAIQDQVVHWIYTAAMQVEALRVVRYPALAKRHDPEVSAQRLAACFSRWGKLCAQPAPQLRLVCSDPDDQIFLDLALAQHASHLLSRDQAVLQLARRARAYGLRIATPETAPLPA